MGLPEQISEFGFGAGLAQKEDSWLSSSGMGTLHNCAQDKSGALEKHPGYTVFGTSFRNGDAAAIFGLLMDLPFSVGIGRAPKLVKRGDQIAAVANGLLFAKSDKWTLQGRVSPWVCEQRIVCQADGGRFDCCCSGNWIYTAYETASGSVHVAVTYAPSNETVTIFGDNNGNNTSRIPTTGISEPRIVAIDTAGTAVLFYMSGTQGKYHVVTPDGVGVAANITLASGYDVVSDPVGQAVWVVYLPNTALVVSSKYTYAASTLTFSATTNQAINNGIACSITVDVTGNRLAYSWVEYIAAGGANFTMVVRAIARTTNYAASVWTLRTIWSQATAEPITTAHGITNLGLAFSPFDGVFAAFNEPQNNRVIGHWVSWTGVVEGGGGVGDPGEIVGPWAYVRSRPAWDAVGQRMFFLADAGINTLGRRGHFVLGIEPRSAAGKAAPQPSRLGVLGAFSYLTAGGITVIGSVAARRISRPFQDSNGVWHLQGFELGGQGATQQLICDYALFADDRVGTFAELGKATYITGAVLSQWDGVRVCEAGFLYDPQLFDNGASAGGSMAVGNYTFAVTYARITATGEVVRSRPSLTVTTAITAGTSTANLEALHPGPSNLLNQDFQTIVSVEFWRSEVNTTTPLFFAGRVLVNLFSAADVVFADTVASHAGAEQLYSDGTNGEIANTPPASPLSLCQWRNRLWMTDGEQLFYTKEAASTRGAEWSQAFFVMSRGAPERLTAVAPLGETLMAFSEDSSSYVYGDGPSAAGDGSTLVGPMPAISELGCTQAAGIAQLPDGLLVRTRRGLHLLDAKRSFNYIGAAIEDTLAAFPRVRSARHISGTNRVWCCLTTNDLTDGIVVALDTHHKTFSTLFSQAEMGGRNMVHASSIDLNGAHSFAVQDGNVYDQNPTNFQLDTSRYGQTVETPWFKGNGPSAELRARRFILLLKNLGNSSIKVEIGYNYEDAYHYSAQIDTSFLVSMEGEPDTLQLRMPFPRQRCQSYRLRFSESLSAANAPGFRFVSLRMVTSLRPGSGRLLSKNNANFPFDKV